MKCPITSFLAGPLNSVEVVYCIILGSTSLKNTINFIMSLFPYILFFLLKYCFLIFLNLVFLFSTQNSRKSII